MRFAHELGTIQSLFIGLNLSVTMRSFMAAGADLHKFFFALCTQRSRVKLIKRMHRTFNQRRSCATPMRWWDLPVLTGILLGPAIVTSTQMLLTKDAAVDPSVPPRRTRARSSSKLPS